MKLEKLPSVHQNLQVAFASREFVHLKDGAVIGAGTIVRALNSENVEANYERTGEKEARQVVLNISQLHYDGVTDSGFCFGDPAFDYSDLPN